MNRIKLVSSDLNGSLVHQHTMSEMIRLYVGEEQFQKANEIFTRQTSGLASMEETFQTAGPLTKGLNLRDAIRYTTEHLGFVDGFDEFLDWMYERRIPFVINSTGYSVTIHAIKEQIGPEKVHGQIGKILHFGLNADSKETLSEVELEQKVKDYFLDPATKESPIYDQIKATGIIDLGIVDDNAKATLIQEYAQRYFPEISVREIVHMGDTMGDYGGITEIAKAGGIGIAFNYNVALEKALKEKVAKEEGRIYLQGKKSLSSNLRNLIPIIESQSRN